MQEVNLSVGEFGQSKMSELNEDTTDEGESLRAYLDRLQSTVLDQYKSNSFLIRLDSKHVGYQAVQKLVDLRLVHLIHPSITPGKAGKRFEAYLLDYSFYTGMRRRHGLTELEIHADEPPRYAELRRLPQSRSKCTFERGGLTEWMLGTDSPRRERRSWKDGPLIQTSLPSPSNGSSRTRHGGLPRSQAVLRPHMLHQDAPGARRHGLRRLKRSSAIRAPAAAQGLQRSHAAGHLLSADVDLSYGAAFHTQQAAETCLKAVLVWTRSIFPRPTTSAASWILCEWSIRSSLISSPTPL